MAVSYSYDAIYKIYAYRENAVRIVATQGEGFIGAISSLGNNDLVKSPRFQLRDDRGVIVIPSSGSPRVQLAIKKSDDTEDLLDCAIIDRNSGIIACPIRKSLTDIAGKVEGEIRLITTNAVTKFYGINFFIYDGVSDSAAAQSSQFSDLIAALQQVGVIIDAGSEGTIELDTVIQVGGTNPVASGILYNYLKDIDDNKWTFVDIADGEARTITQLNSALSENDHTIYTAVLKANELFQGSLRQNVTAIQYDSSLRSMIAQCDGIFFSKKSNGSWGDWSPAISANSIKDYTITSEKIHEEAVLEEHLDSTLSNKLPRVTIWGYSDAQTNNFSVPTSYSGKIGDIVAMTTGTGTGGEIFVLTKIISAYGSSQYYWENITEISNNSITRNKLAQNALPVVFTYTLTSNGWNNSQQTISLPSSYVFAGDVVADIDIGDATFNQLVSDNCIGIYVTSSTSDSTLTLTANALGNTPTANIAVQITLTPITDLTST